MTNAFAAAYRSDQTVLRRIYGPVVDPRAYLRILHLLLMFPLGIAYFVFFVTAFSFGGSMVWTFVGPPVLLVAMWVSLRLGDGEAWLVSRVAEIEIRRPPQKLEGVTSFRQRLWARTIDPTTWTGLVYEIVQFPIGIATFVVVVTLFSVAGSFIASPIVMLFVDESMDIVSDGENVWWAIDTPLEALPLALAGIAAWFVAMHLTLNLSALHAMWAKLMLGTKSRRRPTVLEPDSPEPSPEPPEPKSELPPAAATPLPIVVLPPPPKPMGELKAPEMRPAAEADTDDAYDVPELEELTPREREVTLLLARGMSNADIADTCFISEGTVKTHVKRILSKLELHDRTQVVVFAYERGLVTPGSFARELEEERTGKASPW